MNSTPDTKDVLIARADEELARVRERIANADEDIARVTEQLSKMERRDAPNPSARPGDDARNPSARPGPQPQQGKSAAPGSIGLLPVGLLLAACLVVAAFVSQLSRDGITLIGARWAPQGVLTSFLPPANPPLSAQPGPSSELTRAETAPAQAAQLAQTGPPQDAAPAAADVSEPTPSQQATSSDVADLKREIEQLKLKQDQIVTDNSKAIEQLKVRQEEMARQLAKVSEQSALPLTSLPSAGPAQSPQNRLRPRPPPPPPPARRQYRPRWPYYDDEW